MKCRWWKSGLGLLALVLVPAVAEAGGWLGIRNDLKAPVVVQISNPGKKIHGRPFVLNPDEVSWDSVVQPCVKTIAIYDPKQPNVPLHSSSLNCGGMDVFFSIQMSGGKIDVVPAAPPKKR